MAFRKPASDKDRALRLLGRREHSAKELAMKLKRRPKDRAAADTIETEFEFEEDNPAPAPIKPETVIAELQADNLQSDHRFALSLVRRRAADHYGPMRIRAELKSHGLQATDIEAAFEQSEIDWHQNLTDALARHPDKLKDRTSSLKQAAKYHQRGFPPDLIRQVMKELAKITEED